MQNPTRLSAKIKVSASKNHTKIDKNLQKIDKNRGSKKECIFSSNFIDFGPILGPPAEAKNATSRNKSRNNACGEALGMHPPTNSNLDGCQFAAITCSLLEEEPMGV